MLQFAKFIGANTDFSTAQAFVFPRIYAEGSNDPVFGLIISGEGEDVFVHIRQKILNLEDNFNAPFDRVTDKLHQLLELLKNEFSQVENLQLALFYARENLFYILQSGNSLIEILREGQRVPIMNRDFPQEKIISGFIKTGDRVLILSCKNDRTFWNEEVISEVFNIPFQSVADAEVIFAKDEQLLENEQDLAGIKNIQPVAFILIENQAENIQHTESVSETKVAKKQLEIKIYFSILLLYARKTIRQIFGMFRKIDKKILIAGSVIIVVGILSFGGYLFIQSKKAEENTRRDNLITLIESSLIKAESQKDSDPKNASAELKSALEKVKELESLDPKNPKVLDMKRKFDEKSNEILKIFKNFDLELFMSLDLVRQNFQSKRMSFSIDKILVLDDNEKSLVSIGVDLKSPDILAGKTQLGDAILASINGSDVFTYSIDKGLIHVDTDSEKTAIVSAPDAGWGNIQDIFGFSGNVYVLDSGNPSGGGMIWKYAPGQSGFSQKQEYLKGDANLSRAKLLKIDYSVWVVTDEPDILKFTAGNSDFFALSGLDEPFSQIDGLFVTEDLDNVFILDKSKKRILVTKKNGEYQAQYVSDQFEKADDFFVEEKSRFIYFLIENKIFRTPLR